jgi:hypothetical protein
MIMIINLKNQRVVTLNVTGGWQDDIEYELYDAADGALILDQEVYAEVDADYADVLYEEYQEYQIGLADRDYDSYREHDWDSRDEHDPTL